MTRTQLVVSCEHATNFVPREYRPLFRAEHARLESHLAWDPGAVVVARRAAEELGAPLYEGEATRLLVDLNRSLHHRSLFSRFTSVLGGDAKRKIIDRYYVPYRRSVEDTIRERTRRNRFVLHASIHSFTPVLDGKERHGDLCFLYDPSRNHEVTIVRRWIHEIQTRRPSLRLRRNYPYRGVADGLTTHFRRLFPDNRYAGVEIEINQALLDALPVDEIISCLKMSVAART